MTDNQPHVVTALIRKRAEIAGHIEYLQTQLRQQVIDLDNLDATLRLFVPDIDLQEIKPKPLPPRHSAFKGEVSRVILDTLRRSDKPMTAQDLAQHIMAERGLNTADKQLVRLIGKRVGSSLRHHRAKGWLVSKESDGPHLLWKIA